MSIYNIRERVLFRRLTVVRGEHIYTQTNIQLFQIQISRGALMAVISLQQAIIQKYTNLLSLNPLIKFRLL